MQVTNVAVTAILPGFIDLHVHGGGGADVMEAGDAIQTITRTHARYGTTSLLATTMTAPPLRNLDAASCGEISVTFLFAAATSFSYPLCLGIG